MNLEENNGWIKLYRCLVDKSIWKNSTPEQKVILITLLLMANHKSNEWFWQGEKFKVESGQFITSLENIVDKCGKGISIKNVRTAIKKFEKLGFLKNESTKTGRLIAIVNWQLYQGENMKGGKDMAITGQAHAKDKSPNNNDNNDKNDIYIQIKNIQAVKLKQIQFNKLVDIYGETKVYNKVIQLENYIINGNGAHYRDHYIVLNSWLSYEKETFSPKSKNNEIIKSNFNLPTFTGYN